DSASVRAGQFLRDCKPESGPAAAGRTAEGGEEVFPRLWRQAGSCIADKNAADASRALRGNDETAYKRAFPFAGHGLHRVAGKVRKYPEQLIGVGVNLETGIDIIDEFHAAFAVKQAIHLLHQLPEPQPPACRRRLLRAAIGKYALGIGNRPVE